jgi:hypothetical protein
MAKQLQDDGWTVGRYNARRVMRQAGVTVRRPRQRRPGTPDRRHGHPVAPNLLARQCDVERPDPVGGGCHLCVDRGGLVVCLGPFRFVLV